MATFAHGSLVSLDIQSGIPADDQAQVRRLALPTIRAYRDGGCQPKELSREVLREMMSFLGCRAVEGRLAGLFFDDLQFDGGDTGAVAWGSEIPEDVKSASPVVVIGCGMAGILAGIRLKQAGLPFLIVEKNPGPGGTWWENRYPGARVDIGSHQYCYSFEPPDHWSEFYCQQPELLEYFTDIVEKYELRPHCRFDTAVTKLRWDDEHARWSVHVRGPNGTEEVIDARFVVSAVGSLNIPKLPDIPGMETFSGPSFHSARWPAWPRADRQTVRSGRRRCERLPDRSGHRRRGRTAHDLPAHRSVDHPESALPRGGSGGGQVGVAPPPFLRAVVQVHHDLRRHCRRFGALSDRTRVRGSRQGGRSMP